MSRIVQAATFASGPPKVEQLVAVLARGRMRASLHTYEKSTLVPWKMQQRLVYHSGTMLQHKHPSPLLGQARGVPVLVAARVEQQEPTLMGRNVSGNDLVAAMPGLINSCPELE